VKNIFKIILTISLLWSGQSMAQESKASLDAVPISTNTNALPPLSESDKAEIKAKPAWSGPRLSYTMSMGASFSNGFGSATYIEPTARYQVSNRFRVNASMAYINVMPTQSSITNPEGTTVMYRNNARSHYIGSVGIDYLASDRLMLSGNIWRDFSNVPANTMSYNLYSPGRMGGDFMATYKITEHFSVTGGVRYNNGLAPFNSPFYSPGFGNSNRIGFGY
jgi:hypothetical protein